MRILVTGSRGFIGTHLSNRLKELNHSVFGLDKDNCDLLNLKRLKVFIKRVNPEAVFHLAAYLPYGKGDSNVYFFKNNAEGTLNLLESLRIINTCRLIYSSTMNVYGKTKYLPVDERHPTEPVNLYGLTKLIGEELCEYYARNFAYRVIILRYSGVFGTGKNVGAIASFVSKALRGESLCLEGDGSDIWDTLSFKDVIHANILALKNIDAIKFGLFNIGYGKGLKVKKVAEDIINFTSSLSEIKFKEKNDKIKFYYNIRKAREKLKFNPLPFHQRLKEFIKCSAT